MKASYFLAAAILLALAVPSCIKPEPDPETPETPVLRLTSGNALAFTSEGGSTTVSFTANGAWTVSTTASWIDIDPTQGEGDGSVTLTVQPNTADAARSAFVRFQRGGASASVTVSQDRYIPVIPPFQAVTVYYEDMDRTPTFTDYMSAEGWQNAVGEGAAQVSYDSWNARIRNDNYGSAGGIGTYEGASGQCYGRLTQGSNGTFGHLTVADVDLCGYEHFVFSFGAAQGPEVLKLEVSPDGNTWTQLDYSFDAAYNHWGKISVAFSVSQNVSTLQFRLTLTGAKSQYAYGANIDDLRLETAESGSGIVIDGSSGAGGSEAFAELPAIDTSNPDYYYHTLYARSVRSNLRVRNYSFCYDIRRHNPIWVAFPMHALYAEGSGRSKDEFGNDPWAPYPDLSVDQQSIIWDITGDGVHQYWTYGSPIIYGHTWSKGHLCMSSSRAGAGSDLNLQTFYPVNIAPQSTGNGFGTLWGATEDLHWQKGSQICSDTLYVVAGCHYANEYNTEYDASNYNYTSDYSKLCIMPTHQYKLFLRTRSGYSGKRVQDCKAEELKTIGFWFDSVLGYDASENLSDYALSVEEIERRTGITFFPGIPKAAKAQCTPSDWGL